jgi:hypothetical protein
MLIKANNRNRANKAAMLLEAIIAGCAHGPVKGASKLIAEFRRSLEGMK